MIHQDTLCKCMHTNISKIVFGAVQIGSRAFVEDILVKRRPNVEHWKRSECLQRSHLQMQRLQPQWQSWRFHCWRQLSRLFPRVWGSESYEINHSLKTFRNSNLKSSYSIQNTKSIDLDKIKVAIKMGMANKSISILPKNQIMSRIQEYHSRSVLIE